MINVRNSAGFIFILLFMIAGCSVGDEFARQWTFMVYLDGDNDLEGQAVRDVLEMTSGARNNPRLDIIVLIDLQSGSAGSAISGDNFSGSRLYRIRYQSAERISGGVILPGLRTDAEFEVNMGNAETLRDFIRLCKQDYPARHYALVLWNHGSGARSAPGVESEDIPFKAVCQDVTSGDILDTAEISDVLTENESVDGLIFDACFMGYAEVAWQYAPRAGAFHASYMVATPSTLWGYGLDYHTILKGLHQNMRNATPAWLGSRIISAQQSSTAGVASQSFALYDLAAMQTLHTATSGFAALLASGGKKNEITGNSASEWSAPVNGLFREYC